MNTKIDGKTARISLKGKQKVTVSNPFFKLEVDRTGKDMEVFAKGFDIRIELLGSLVVTRVYNKATHESTATYAYHDKNSIYSNPGDTVKERIECGVYKELVRN